MERQIPISNDDEDDDDDACVSVHVWVRVFQGPWPTLLLGSGGRTFHCFLVTSMVYRLLDGMFLSVWYS